MDWISLVIIIAAIIVCYCLVLFGYHFRDMNNRMKNVVKNFSQGYSEELSDEGDVHIDSSNSIIYDRHLLEEIRDDFEKELSWYIAIEQMIPIFPLLGIFGTVYGLVNSVLTDVDSLVMGLNIALRTTLYGLIASIGLKAVDSLFSNRYMNNLDSEFNKADTVILRQTLKEEIHKNSRTAKKKQSINTGGKADNA